MKNTPNKLENEIPPYPPYYADIYTPYEVGMHCLLERMGRSHARYAEALSYQQQLEENIRQARRYRDTSATRSERFEIIDRLNGLTLFVLGISFNDLYSSDCTKNKRNTRSTNTVHQRWVQFTIDLDLTSISVPQIFEIQQAIGQILNTDPNHLTVNFVATGSTIIDISLYDKDLLTLRSLLLSNSEQLHQLGIVKVVLGIEDGQQEVWIAEDGHFQLVPATSSEFAPRPSFLALTQETIYGATAKILRALNPRRLRDLPIVSEAFFERIAKLGEEFSLQTNPAPAFGLGPRDAPDSLKKLAATYETTRQLTQGYPPAEIQMLIQKNKWQETLKKQAEGVARKFMGRRDARQFADAYVKEFIGQTDLLLILSANHHSFEF